MWKNSPKIYSVEQIRALEKDAVEFYGITEAQLMQRAGMAAFQLLQKNFPNAKDIFVFCGQGNNGGDGYVLAHLAHLSDFNVKVRYIGQPYELKEVSHSNFKICEEAGIDVEAFDPNEKIQADVIVDALLGIGVKGEIREPYVSAIKKINDASTNVLSIDIPSGLDADSGKILGAVVQAKLTSTFIGYKKGLVTGAGIAVSGSIYCDALGLPKSAFESLSSEIVYLLPEQLKMNLLPPRSKNAHKGDFGHVLVIGGEYGMAGAARMAAEAAARCGAGLVSVATHREHVDIISAARPELMCHAIESAQDLIPLFKKASVIVIGPGLGKAEWGKALLMKTLGTHHPKVIDADALNLLSQDPSKNNNWVLTPHPGEAARLLDCDSQYIQNNRYQAAADIQDQYGGVCVLKGAGTVIKSESLMAVCGAGNPGMASGGMGDVLSGVIAGLISQGIDIAEAAELGVLIHAVAADIAAKDGERGLLALDVVDAIRSVVNGLR